MSTSGNWWDNFDDSEKYKKLEANYAQRLMQKYFSDKNIYGEKIYEKESNRSDETIRAGSWLCAQSFADPVAFKEAVGGASPSLTIPSFKDPNTALAPISKAPTAASASGSGHVQSSKDPNTALVSVAVQASEGFKDPNVVLGSVPVQSFKSPKIGSSSTGKGFTKLSKKKHK